MDLKLIAKKNNWKLRKLDKITFFQEGPGVRNHQYTTNGVKLLNVANLFEGQLDLSRSDRFISEDEAYGKYSHFLVDEGDLIIACSGIQVDYFHKKMGFVKKEHLPLCMNTSTMRFKTLDENILNLNYLAYYLKTDFFKKQIQRLITGSAQLNFGPSHIKKIDILIPPLETQKKIVEVLDKAQGLIDARKEQITLMDELIQSVFYEMFGNPDENHNNHKISILDDLCIDIVDCPHSTPKDYVEYSNFPSIRTTEISNGSIDWSDMKYVTEEEYKKRTKRIVPVENDIIYGREGSYGDAVLLPKEHKFCLGQRVMLLRADNSKCYPEFLWFSVKSDYVYRQALSKNVGSTVGRVNVKDVKNFWIMVPKLEKQKDFVLFTKSIYMMKAKIEESLSETVVLFDSLMQEYFK